jgi:hypothetical protein
MEGLGNGWPNKVFSSPTTARIISDHKDDASPEDFRIHAVKSSYSSSKEFPTSKFLKDNERLGERLGWIPR